MISGHAKVEIENLIKIYRDGSREVVALKGVDLTVASGDVVAVTGPSGCGKTTLLNLIGGLDKPSAGRVVVDGKDISRASERELEEHRLSKVGFIFQFFNLIPDMTALENVEMPMRLAGRDRAAARMRAVELLASVRLNEEAAEFPDDLSGGEQQRVAIACALANDPQILLADEPTGELDSETAKSVIDLLIDIIREEGKTAIIVTHDLMIAQHADRIVRLDHGRITDQRHLNSGTEVSDSSSAASGPIQTRF